MTDKSGEDVPSTQLEGASAMPSLVKKAAGGDSDGDIRDTCQYIATVMENFHAHLQDLSPTSQRCINKLQKTIASLTIKPVLTQEDKVEEPNYPAITATKRKLKKTPFDSQRRARPTSSSGSKSHSSSEVTSEKPDMTLHARVKKPVHLGQSCRSRRVNHSSGPQDNSELETSPSSSKYRSHYASHGSKKRSPPMHSRNDNNRSKSVPVHHRHTSSASGSSESSQPRNLRQRTLVFKSSSCSGSDLNDYHARKRGHGSRKHWPPAAIESHLDDTSEPSRARPCSLHGIPCRPSEQVSTKQLVLALNRLDQRLVPKPDTFDSTTGQSFDIFLKSFEEYCTNTFRGSSSLWVSELGRFLKGEMLSAYNSLKVPGDSYKTVVGKLRKWRRDSRESYQTEARQRFAKSKMLPGEGFRLYAARLEKTYRLAYPRRDVETSRTLREKFLETIPKSFRKQLKTALSLCVTMKGGKMPWAQFLALASRQDAEHEESDTDRVIKEDDSVWVNTYSPTVTSTSGPQRYYQKSSEKWPNPPTMKRSTTGTHAGNLENQDKTCHYCHKVGHIQQECRRRLGLCLVCGSPDHRISACPKRRTLPTNYGGQTPWRAHSTRVTFQNPHGMARKDSTLNVNPLV